MGGKDSSSKRKSSKRKRGKTSSKKSSRRKEPKKRRRSYDSVTAYSDDDSSNSEHSLSYTSKSDRRRINKNKKHRRDPSVSSYSDYQSVSSDSDSLSKSRKARQSRVGLKDTKKRARKRFSSPESDSDVDVRSVQKRKRLDRDRVVKPIKKSSKKKSRKHLSSSFSSDSESFSTGPSRSSSSTADGQRQRSKVILNKEIGKRKGRESHKGKKKQKLRTPRSSSCGSSDPTVSVSNSEGALFPMNNSRRLRSVIAVVDQPPDAGENRWEMDLHKEEIVYDQNDYPSPKSLDSNDGGSKMESEKHSHGAFSNRICVENVAGEEAPELGKSSIDEGDQNKPGDHQPEGVDMNDSLKEKEVDVSVPDPALGGDVLESILRQKALENLTKFKGRLQKGPRSTTVKMNNESDFDRLSTATVDIVQNKSIKQGSSNAQEMNQKSDLIAEVNKLTDSEHVEKDPGMDNQSDEHMAVLLKCSEVDERANSHAVLAKPVLRSDTGAGTGGANTCSSSTVEPSSSVVPISGEHSLEQENEAKGGSEFEQKTMSVMRGGEMVQVSYKVYIPRRAPALARRQLRR